MGKTLILGSTCVVCSSSDNLFLLPKVKTEIVPMVPLSSLEGILYYSLAGLGKEMTNTLSKSMLSTEGCYLL